MTPQSPVANQPEPRKPTPKADFKPATPDLLSFATPEIPVEYMTDVIFEEIGGQEILSVTRSDLINGQSVIYHPIRNATQLGIKYGPSTIIPMPDTIDSYFNGKVIKLSDRLPETGEVISIDEFSGNLVVFVDKMLANEQVVIEMLYAENPSDDIIWSED